MFDSSPIESWEGASAIFSFGAGSGTTILLFWLTVVLCVAVVLHTED